ncbi:TetR/AcrR family transcriptional regulator [Nonomuraea sp. MCN248]|uniref:TetR/AcrR family transcriptional regulator n=1 Tax=Nonomuraea corallina TaxID=2989783 RepID=A0ABT4SFP9_9ACTN|nr:TetR/AcrR family transcriptional regulator [Nonomuraea corallina]MDA0635965.1 TetR/AcrR family transcriptional regulator [Nonomuraea corallina]
MADTSDRRARRRAQTLEEILDLALDLMAEEGVAGLSLSAAARRLGIRPPSLYKYFPSRHAVYDALFERGQRAYLEAVRRGAAGREPGLAAMAASLEAGARWVMANQALAQLMFWRPVPGFEPSARAYAPALAVHDHFTALTAAAIERGELHPDAASEEGQALGSSLIAGLLSQQLSNEPDAAFEEGRFTRWVARLPGVLVALYPPR